MVSGNPGKVLVTGAKGFIAGYVIERLLDCGYEVVGIDNGSKYGLVPKSYDSHPFYRFVEGDAKDVDLLSDLMIDCDHCIAIAASIGGIGYFHALAYDLLAENSRITSATFEAAVQMVRKGKLKKITVFSSSMVFENTQVFPTPESQLTKDPPPSSSYGLQKLECEYFARMAWAQYRLPYTILRPFNCIGTGELHALNHKESRELGLSHVVPDLVQKVLRGKQPVPILGDGSQTRCYTYGADIAACVERSLEHPGAHNEDFNISTARETTVRELLQEIWRRVHGQEPLEIETTPAFAVDVQRRIPDVSKARRILGFEATTPLGDALDIIIPWVRENL